MPTQQGVRQINNSLVPRHSHIDLRFGTKHYVIRPHVEASVGVPLHGLRYSGAKASWY